MYLFSVFPSFLLSFSLRSRATAHSGQTSLKTADSSALDVRRSRGRERRRVGKRARYVSHTEQVLALSSSGLDRPRCFQGYPDDPDLHANGTRNTQYTHPDKYKDGQVWWLIVMETGSVRHKDAKYKTHTRKQIQYTHTHKQIQTTHTHKQSNSCMQYCQGWEQIMRKKATHTQTRAHTHTHKQPSTHTTHTHTHTMIMVPNSSFVKWWLSSPCFLHFAGQ